jgi:replication factor A1
MSGIKEELYPLVKDILRKEDYEMKIKEIQKETGELVNEDCAAFLLIDRLGRNSLPYSRISETNDGDDASFFLTVDEIICTRSIDTKNSQSKIAELSASDETGKCKLVLLGKHVEIIEDGLVSKGSKLKVVNAHVKVNENGIELTLGWWGMLELNPASVPNVKTSQTLKELLGSKFGKKFYDIETLNTLSEKSIVSVNATITDMKKMRKFTRKDGGEGKVANLKIDDGTGSVSVVLWGSAADFVDGLEIGDYIELSKVRVKKNEKISETGLEKGLDKGLGKGLEKGLELHSISGTSIRKLNANQ